MMSTPQEPPRRSAAQTAMLALGALLMIAGVVCIVLSFSGAGEDEVNGGADRTLALFGGGGFALVVGFGIVAFTRVAIMRAGGMYSRVVIEQGYAPPAPTGSRFCSRCGAQADRAARFCDSCGSPLG